MKRLAIVLRPTGLLLLRGAPHIRLTHAAFLLLTRRAVRAVRLSFIFHVQYLLSYQILM